MTRKVTQLRPGVVRIKFAADCSSCECCGEPYCDDHQMHYAECECLGPHNAEDEGFDVREFNGVLYAVPSGVIS